MAAFLTTLAAHPIIILFLFLNLAISFWAHSKSKANSFEDYALASRSLPTGVLVMTLLGTFIDNSTFTRIDSIFAHGVVQSLPAFGMIFSFLLIGTFIAPCLVYFSQSTTLGSLMGIFYGRVARLTAGFVCIFSSLLVISAQISALGTISSILFNIEFSTAVLLFGPILVFYSTWGGMRAVSYTDVFQLIAVILVITWITQKAVHKVGGTLRLFQSLSQNHPDKLSLLSHPKFYVKLKAIAFWGLPFSATFSPPIVQRMLVTRDKRQIRHMWYYSTLVFGLIVLASILISLSYFLVTNKSNTSVKNTLLSHIILSLFKPKSWAIDIVFIGILSTLFSTMDSFLHTVGISFVEDIIVPLRAVSGNTSLSSSKRVSYAKLGVGLVGILSIFVGFQLETSLSLFEINLLMPSMLLYMAITIPLFFGIIGIKTDRASWVSFCLVYFSSIGVQHGLRYIYYGGGALYYDYFLLAFPLSTLAYFLTHIYINGGIVFLKRSEQTIAEQLWIPTWQGSVKYLKGWLLAPFRLHILASRKVVNNPTHSLSFSMLIFALYAFSSVMAGGSNDVGLANFMAGVHLVGITLCVGVMLEGIWPDRIKPFFALYWFFTLFYCLAFGSTLTFLRAHGDMMAVIKWIVNFIFLLVLVDSMSFITLSCLGSGLAMVSWYVVFRSIPSDVLGSIGLPGIYLLAGLLVAVLLFASSREQHVNQRFDWNRTASSALGHDLRLTVGMLEGTGRALSNAFKVSESITNTKGEKGYWMPQGQAAFLESFSKKMIERGAMAGKEIQDFSDFIKSQVVGIFEQKETGIRAAAEEAIHKLKDKMPPTVKMKVSGAKDFSPKVLSGVFTNVFYNLLWNAVTHGKASEVEIRIDGVKRTVTVWDNGRGIPSDVLPRIFDLNFSTGMKRTKNSGVGLAFVKMVIAASSGKISCHSRRGDKRSFTAFVMEFPEV